MYNFDSWLKTVTHHVGRESALLEMDSSSILAQVMQRLGFDFGSGNFTLVGVFSVHVFCSHLVCAKPKTTFAALKNLVPEIHVHIEWQLNNLHQINFDQML